MILIRAAFLLIACLSSITYGGNHIRHVIHVPQRIKNIYHTKIIKVPQHHHHFHEKEKIIIQKEKPTKIEHHHPAVIIKDVHHHNDHGHEHDFSDDWSSSSEESGNYFKKKRHSYIETAPLYSTTKYMSKYKKRRVSSVNGH